MSRSNPNVLNANPTTRWVEWDGANGNVVYFDKTKTDEKNPKGTDIVLPMPFIFLVLDELATIRGFDERKKQGFYANEIRDTRDEPLLVKYYKGGEVLAHGLYTQIKDTVVARGGGYTSSVYILTKNEDGKPQLDNIQFKGAALGAWMEQRKKLGKDIYEKAIMIVDAKQEKKGNVTFFAPVFKTKDVGPDTNAAALAMDKEILQPFLTEYLKKPSSPATQQQIADVPLPNDTQDPPDRQFNEEPVTAGMEEDDIPF